MNKKSYELRKRTFMPVRKKQFYLLAAGLLFAGMANAQLKKGDILLGGNVNFSKQTTDPTAPSYIGDNTNLSISPSIGKAVREDLLVGLDLAYSYNMSKTASPTYVSTRSSYGLGAFIRKYKTLGAGFALFAEGDLGGAYLLSRSYPDGGAKPPADKAYTISAGFYPGVAYFLGRHVQVEAGLQNTGYIQYAHTKTGQDAQAAKSSEISVGSSLNQALTSFVVGFKWVI